MLGAMIASVATMMLVSRPLERTIGQYPGLTVSVLLATAVYVLVSRMLGPKPPA